MRKCLKKAIFFSLSELQEDINRDKKLADKKMKWRFQVVKSSRTCPLGGIPGVFVPPLQ